MTRGRDGRRSDPMGRRRTLNLRLVGFQGLRRLRPRTRRGQIAYVAVVLVFVAVPGGLEAASFSSASGRGATEDILQSPGFSALAPSVQAGLSAQVAQLNSVPPAPETGATPPPAAQASVALPTPGIVATQQGPFSPEEFIVTSEWSGDVNGQWWTVYAGGQGDGAAPQGAKAGVVVYRDPANLNTGQPVGLGTLLTPVDGTMTLTSANGGVLDAVAQGGASYALNLASSSGTAPVGLGAQAATSRRAHRLGLVLLHR
jgi:hypothetical protein